MNGWLSSGNEEESNGPFGKANVRPTAQITGQLVLVM